MSSVKSTASEISETFASALTQLTELTALVKSLQKAVGAKKPRATGPKGPGSAWTAWTSQAKTLFPEEYAEHLADLPPNDKGEKKKNDPMGFAQKCRASLHVDEWTAFEAKWKEEHPKVAAEKAVETEPKSKASAKPKGKAKAKADELAAASSGASSEEEAGYSSSASKKSGLPKATPVPKNLEPKNWALKIEAAASKPKRTSKAAKEVAAAAATEAAKADPPVPWESHLKKKYLKNDKDQLWQVGEDGSIGAWVGTLKTVEGKKNPVIEKSIGPA